MLLNVNAMLLALLSVDERFNSLARPAPLPANTQVFDPSNVLIVPEVGSERNLSDAEDAAQLSIRQKLWFFLGH
jgi:hypothetical protein